MDAEHNRTTSTSESTSLGSLLTTLTREMSSLVRQETQLAKAEMSEKTHQAMSGVGAIAIAGAVLFSGFLVLLAAAVFLLNEVLPPDTTPWLSAIIVGLVVAIIGYVMLKSGLKKLQTQNLMPNRTMASLQSDRDLARHHETHAKEELK
ncbi:phage holin family protein [Halomonas sp. TRM85114]|uniref:phage holin family protein n=1 Tax=Halomonas jincaotanensis TaxID=2810616 RepID=UPI001BD2E23A|nr:phage holin family protein [Halomonas jincaotanensis]MBS9404607.1 phage holin family protein [Halomonas jincaotanensis]